ncbi:MAG: VWFA-related Acidobacterial domain protein [Acidobacteria bacterium]|nr:VWFA-related Acidobacterial domain protein [Acidobacteriota bacterium]
MARRLREVLVAIVFLVAAAAHAQQWSSDLDDALARSRSERKLIVLHLRADCGRCNAGADDFLRDAATHELFTSAYKSFLLVRADVRGATGAVAKLRERRLKLPAVVVLDPSGEIVQEWRRFDAGRLAPYAMTLITLRRQTPLLVQGAGFRLAGQTTDADFILARAWLERSNPAAASDLLRRIIETRRSAGDTIGMRQAELYLLYATLLDTSQLKSRRMSAIDELRKAAARATNAATATTAHLLSAAALTMTNYPRSARIEHYRKAYELALPGSDEEEAARTQLAAFDPQPLPAKASRKAALRLLVPALAIISGRTELRAEGDAAIARVEFLVDGSTAARSAARPFQANVDFGPMPVAHELRVIGYDKGGQEIAEAVETINDRAGVFRVRITSPGSGTTATKVNVEAVADVPDGRTLRTVDVFWKDRKLATLTAPPFRVPVELPPGFGYIRVVGTLDDGTVAEDTRVLSGDAAEAVEVQGVVVPATVQDHHGVRVPNLTSKDFVVQEDGQRVDAIVRAAEDAPVTIGIAIDTSGSMQPKILDLVEMVTRLLDQTVSPQTTVFLVGFDAAPYLLHPPSNDARSLRTAALSVIPADSTALYDGLTYALQQFQGVPGKKALIVISDGQEVSSRNSAATCTRLARALSVPIYGISPVFGRTGNAVAALAADTGGLMVYNPTPAEQPKAFASIAEEVRGQYLISFVSRLHRKPGDWIRLGVSVAGASVRTVSGYFAR